jgi:uncharacterized protein (TIGR02452 family)
MYEINKQDNHDCLYSGHIVYSDKIPVFRDDCDNQLLETPYRLSIITVPAVNTTRALEKNVSMELIDSTIYQRIDNLFSIAVNHDVDILILGAWGCGVFGGDFNKVGSFFVKQLCNKYDGFFKSVVFAMKHDNVNVNVIGKILDYHFNKA